MLAKLAADDTALVLSAGMDCRLLQFWNILSMLVTAAVLNKGTDWRLLQFSNILAMLVTAAVLNKGTDWRLKQFWNVSLGYRLETKATDEHTVHVSHSSSVE
jgi:hypothetical protein